MFELADSASSTEANNIGNDTPFVTLISGEIISSSSLWTALNEISRAPGERHGVLVINSTRTSGKIGIFFNRWITGGLQDHASDRDLEAVKALLSVEEGQFYFRSCEGDESIALCQNVAIDLLELGAAKDSNFSDPHHLADAVSLLASMKAQTQMLSSVHDRDELETMHVTDRNVLVPESGRSDIPSADEDLQKDWSCPESEALVKLFTDAFQWAVVSEKQSEGPFDYLQWPTAEGSPTVEQSALSEILVRAVPQRQVKSQAGEVPDHQRLIPISPLPAGTDEPADGANPNEPPTQTGSQNKCQLAQGWSIEELRALPTPPSMEQAPACRPKSIKRARFDNDLARMVYDKGDPVTNPKAFVQCYVHDPVEPQQPLARKRLAAVASVSFLVLMVVVWLLGQWQSHAASDRCIAAGKQCLQKGCFADAARLFTQATEKTPGYTRAYFYRSLAYAEGGHTLNALADIDRAIKFKTIKGRPFGSISHFLEIGAGEPIWPSIITARASMYVQLHQYDKAIEDANAALSSDPTFVEAYEIRALCRTRKLQIGAAVDDANAGLALSQDSEVQARLFWERGIANEQRNNWLAAAQDFSEVIKLNPNEQTYMQMGDTYRDARMFNKAAQCYSKVLEFNQRSYDAYVKRGISLSSVSSDKSAIADFGRALQLNPNGFEALLRRGLVHKDRKEWALAASDLEDALAINPGLGEARYQLQTVYSRWQRRVPFADSVRLQQELQPPLKLPADPQALMVLGYKDLASGLSEEAVQCFDLVTCKEPSNPVARKYLAYSLYSCGQYKQAVSQFSMLRRLSALDTESTIMLAKALAMSGKQSDAVNLLESLMSAAPSQHLRAALAEVCKMCGFDNKAIKLCKEGLAQAQTQAEIGQFQQILNSRPDNKSSPAGVQNPPSANSTGTANQFIGG